jgi:Ni2+-binding GTPase involved in maturation of urease and hydrogenase
MIDIKPESAPMLGLIARSVFLKINVIGPSGSGKTTFGI